MFRNQSYPLKKKKKNDSPETRKTKGRSSQISSVTFFRMFVNASVTNTCKENVPFQRKRSFKKTERETHHSNHIHLTSSSVPKWLRSSAGKTEHRQEGGSERERVREGEREGDLHSKMFTLLQQTSSRNMYCEKKNPKENSSILL